MPNNAEAERALLGSVILDPGALDIALELGVAPEDFFQPRHRVLFQRMIDLGELRRAIDFVTLGEELSRDGMIERAGGAGYIASLTDGVPVGTTAAVGEYCRIVKEKATIRQIINASDNLRTRALEGADDAVALVELAQSQFFELADQRTSSGFVSVREVVRRSFGTIDALFERRGAANGVETGFVDLDGLIGCLSKDQFIVIAARPSQGKAQPLSEPILMRDGTWRAIGDLRISDQLASIDGSESHVTGIFKQGIKPIFQVEFSDGRITRCCNEHLWNVHYRDWKIPRILPLSEISRMLQRKRYKRRLNMPILPNGDFGSPAALPIDPWLLGVILGDGSITGTRGLRISSADEGLLNRVRSLIKPEFFLKHCDRYDYSIIRVGGANRKGVSGVVPNDFIEAVKRLGLWGKRSEEKFVPSIYLQASRFQRLELLRGLMDTDGWSGANGPVQFASSSHILAENVQDLIRSLGGIATIHRKITPCLPSHTVNICIADSNSIFWLKRKQIRHDYVRHKRLTFKNVSYLGDLEAICISVSHPSQEYITHGYTPTHNTALALNIAAHAALQEKKGVGFFSLEMSESELILRLLCAEARVDTHKLRTGFASKEDWGRMTAALGRLAAAPLYIDDSPALGLGEMRAKARRLVAEKKAGLIIVDFLQLVKGEGENRTQEVSSVSRALLAMAKELHVPVIGLSQMSRLIEQRSSGKPQLSDLRESGSIEQDAHVVIFIYRLPRRATEDEEEMGQVGTVTGLVVAKQRNGPTGELSLVFLKPYVKFENAATESMFDQKAAAAGERT